jgi:hypothetical protein
MQWEKICRYADQLLFRLLTQGEGAMDQTVMSGVVNGVDIDQMGKNINVKIARRTP